MSQWTKDPDAVLDWTWDWSAWLASGESISSVTVTPETGITVDSSSNDTTTVTAWLSGGTAGGNYLVTARIVTTAGRTDDRSIELRVRER